MSATTVIDASLLAALLIDDERTDATAAVARDLERATLIAPGHLRIEIVSVLVTAQRRGRVEPMARALLTARASEFPIAYEAVTPERVGALADLAVATGLSVYDAAYLELAIREDAALATNDRQLAATARARGLSVLTTLGDAASSTAPRA